MDVFNKIGQSFELVINNLGSLLKELLPGVLLLLAGIALAYGIQLIFRLLLKWIKFDAWFEKAGVQRMFRILNIEIKPHRIIGMLIFWSIFLVFLDAIADESGWTSVTGGIRKVLSFVPVLFGGILIVFVGRFIASFVRKSINAVLSKSGAASAKLLSRVAYYSLLIVTLTIAASFIGIDMVVITANISVILGVLLFSFSLAFAYASRDLLKNILSSSYNRSNFKVGQKVVIEGNEGEIIKITNISIIIKTAEKIQVIPAKKFTEEVVEIIGD